MREVIAAEQSVDPVLSIVIPTKNRAKYAISTIKGILAWTSSEFELVVQDNGTSTELADALRDIQDPRLRYFRHETPLDMEANFSRAAANACGHYLAFIGDDDGIVEQAIEVAHWADAESIDAVFPSGLATYQWPDVVTRPWGRRFSGVLRVSPFTGATVARNGEAEIHKCLCSAGQQFHGLPRTYFGLVRRDTLEIVRRVAGSSFPGPSPDMASAVAVACVAKRIAEIEYPIFIHGTAARSVGGLGAVKRHIGRLEDWPHLPRWAIDRWSTRVPRLFLGQSIWAEDVVQALSAMHRDDLLDRLNTPKLYAMTLCFHRDHRSIIWSHARAALRTESGWNRAAWLARFTAGYVSAWWQRLVSLGRNVSALVSLSGERMIGEVDDSECAMKALTGFLKKSGVRLEPRRAVFEE